MSTLAVSRVHATKWAKRVAASEASRAALILIIILNVLFFPCIWGNKTLLESARSNPSIMPKGAWAGKPAPVTWAKSADGAAAAWFFEPSLAITGHDYRTGVLPLWNPYQGYGQPFAADMQSQPFFPLTALLSLHLTPLTYNLYLLVRLFIAGFFTYSFLMLFVDFLPAITGGIAAMLGGYYVLEMVMPHISVEMLTPAALFAGEQLIRKRTYGSFIGFTAVLFLMNLGGMPESALLAFTLVYCYLGFRVLLELDLRNWFALSGRIILASLAALGLSSVILLPFLEFLRHSYNTHELVGAGGQLPGLWSYSFTSGNAFTYLFPLMFGPYHQLTSQCGILAFFLILISLIGLLTPRPKGYAQGSRERLFRSATCFFNLSGAGADEAVRGRAYK